MAKKSKHYLPQEKGKDKLTTISPADKKGPGRNNVKIRDYGKNRLSPVRSTTSTPARAARCPPPS